MAKTQIFILMEVISMFDAFTTKDRTFIVDEKDVTLVLTILNEIGVGPEYEIYKNDEDDELKWSIGFISSDNVYGHVVDNLNEKGNLTLKCKGQKAEIYFNRKEEEES